MNLPPKINTIIDAGGLLVALVVDIVLNIICFSVLAPDTLTRVAFVAIGVMIVLFVFRSWSKRQFVAWGIFVIVVFFFDLSFTLEATRTQAEETQQTQDTELTRIDGLITDTNEAIKDLRLQYKEAMKRETMDELQIQLDNEQVKLSKYEDDRDKRFEMVESGETSKTEISAENIFNAIPNAFNSRRLIPLFIWALVFLGVQLIVASSIDNKKELHKYNKNTKKTDPKKRKRKPRSRPAEPKIRPNITLNDVKLWVRWNWYRVTEGQSDYLIDKSVFFSGIAKQDIEFDESKYDYLLKRAKELKVIDSKGHALVKDEAKAVGIIVGEK